MKKLIYILIAFSAFSFGVVVYYLRPIVSPVSLCEVAQHAELYQFNEIHIKANLEVGIDGNILFIFELKKGCEDGSADLQFSENFDETLPKEKLSEEMQNLIEQLKEQSSENLTATAEVEVTGKIVKRSMACFAPPFYVQVKDIKQISPIKLINVREEIRKIRDDD